MLLSNLNLLAQAPNGVARLRELILTLAVQGKLVPQDPADEPASALLMKIRAEKDRLIAEGKVKRDKPLAEIAEEEKPFDLPKGWEWVRLGSLLDRLSNGYSGDQSKTPSPYPLTRIETISAAWINYERVGYCANLSQEEIEKYRLVTGDILLSHINSDIHLGKTAIVKDDRLLIHGINLLLLRPSIFMCAAYVNLAITQRRYDGYFLSIAQHAIGQASINQSKLGATLVSLPPAAEQSRIVTRVEELMRLCDTLEAQGQLEATQHAQLVSTLLTALTDSETPAQLADNWHRIATHFDLLLDRPEAVDALEQTILQLAVRGLLVPQSAEDGTVSEILDNPPELPAGNVRRRKILRRARSENLQEDDVEFPKSWQATSIQELYDANIVIDYGDGNHGSLYPRSSEFGPAGVTFVSAKDINDGIVNWDSCSKLDSTRAAQLTKGWAKGGDVLLTHNATVGRVALVESERERFLLGTSVTFYRTNPLVLDATYLFLVFLSPTWQLQLEAVMAQTTRNQVSIQKQAELRIPLPPIAEQSRIVTRVAQLRRLCADLRQRLAASQSTQVHLAEALVQEVA